MLTRQKRIGFFYHTSLVRTNGSTTITQRGANRWDQMATLQFTANSDSHVFLVGSAWSLVLWIAHRTKPLLELSIEHNWWCWANNSRQIVSLLLQTLFSRVMMQENNSCTYCDPSQNLLRKIQLGSSNSPAPFTRHYRRKMEKVGANDG